ncbi:MAG: hypothetical protein IT330_00940 [Anaerolineae bacterium]|nr:hypothetical protein [Anaerolineae bacterium]
MSRTKPILVMFYHHWDNPDMRERSVIAIRTVTDLYERYGVRAHYGFVGAVLQELWEDSPQTVEKIIRLRMPIGYHGGAGHAPVGPVGHPQDTRNMTWGEAVRALWTFETHTLDVEMRQPVPGRMGGYLAIQSILGVIPLPTDAKGTGRMDTPGEYVLARMGAGSYAVSAPFGPDAIILSPLHELHLSPDSGYGVPPTYFGKPFGVDAPMLADPLHWFATLARNLPDERTYVVHCMTHAGFDPAALDRLLGFLAGHPGDFRVTHPDPDSAQWQPENSALAFYRRTYGIQSLADLLNLGEPPTPLPVHVTAAEIAKVAESVLSSSLLNTHDGDFAEPPEFIDLGYRRLSLADAFQALARALAYWATHRALPDALPLPFLHGPVDYPRYGREVRPALPDIQFIGYTPTELPLTEMPAPAIINSQGLPPAGDYHIWQPTHTLAEGEVVIAAASALDLADHVPGIVRLSLRAEDSREEEPRFVEVVLNPAEFLYAMAQVYRQLARDGQPGPVALVSIKVAATQRTECVLVKPGGPRDSFLWRSDLTPAELDAAWTRVPAPGEERILWMSLPPLGDKVKRRMGRLLGEWNLKKR